MKKNIAVVYDLQGNQLFRGSISKANDLARNTEEKTHYRTYSSVGDNVFVNDYTCEDKIILKTGFRIISKSEIDVLKDFLQK